MSLFTFRWLRRFMRRNTNEIPEDTAVVWKKRLSVIYMVVAWQAFGLVVYMCSTGKADYVKYMGKKSEAELALTPAQAWTRTLNIPKATVYRVEGLNVSKYQINNEEEEEETSK